MFPSGTSTHSDRNVAAPYAAARGEAAHAAAEAKPFMLRRSEAAHAPAPHYSISILQYSLFIPLVRSLTLWFGLFGLVFLLWAWADSFERSSGAWVQRGRPFVTARNHSSTVQLAWGYVEPGNNAGISREISSDPERPLLWARPRFEKERGGSASIITLRLPHWLLLCLYLPAWAILLAWRRRKRAAAGKAAPGETLPPPRRSPRNALRNLHHSFLPLLAPLAGFRFHRLLSFWGGLFGLAFLTSAAVDSARSMSTWSHYRHGVHWELIHSSAALYIGRSIFEEKTPSAWAVTMTPPTDFPPGFAKGAAPVFLGDRLTWGHDLAEVRHPFGGNLYTRDTRHLTLPYRHLILLYCAAWLLLIVWRLRRIHRLSRPPIPREPAGQGTPIP